MKIQLKWQTAYRYEPAVRMAHTELHVLPATRFGQDVTSASIHVDPEGSVGVLVDAFGNQVHHVGVLGSVERIFLEVDATVTTPPGYQGVREELSPLHRFLALQETRRCSFHSSVGAFAADAGWSGDALIYAFKLMELIADRFDFEVGKTDVNHTALQFIELGGGVCQDFAHLMIACLRMRDIPAFYVSGYLAPSEGTEETTASHAWVHAYVDGTWHGFDPANRQRQDERYVVVSVGRDYDDVPPVRGSVRGASQEDYSTLLRVHAEQPQ